jgi:hypothetical protein
VVVARKRAVEVLLTGKRLIDGKSGRQDMRMEGKNASES